MLFGTFLLITDHKSYNFLRDLLPNQRFVTKAFDDVTVDDTPKSATDVIVVHGVGLNGERYNALARLLSGSATPMFGIDLVYGDDTIDLSIFEHLFHSDAMGYEAAVTLTSKQNVTLAPKMTQTVSTTSYVVGVIGGASETLETLPKYSHISYVSVKSNNPDFLGCHGIIVSGGQLTAAQLAAIAMTCKPVLIINGQDDIERIRAFLRNDLLWGRRVEEHTSSLWWKDLRTRTEPLVAHVRDPSTPDVLSVATPLYILSRLAQILDRDMKWWFYGESVAPLSELNMDGRALGQLVSMLTTRRLNTSLTEIVKTATYTETPIDVQAAVSDALDAANVERQNTPYIAPVISKRPEALINLDPYLIVATPGHRSGWKHAVRGLATLERKGREGAVLFDSCLEQTFLWGAEALAKTNAIPYTRPWIGVIHHTFSPHCAPHDCRSLFESPRFIESLSCCRALVVMSEYLASQVRDTLVDVQFPWIRVAVVKHPTELVGLKYTWSPDKFDGTLAHVGGFLRNISAFNELSTPFKKLLVCNDAPEGDDQMCVGTSSTSMSSSEVERVDRLSDEEYDALLTRSAVFLNLYDASASNTLIECIVRKTPIIVNRHPAVVEYIGANYPGLYDTLEEASALCTEENLLQMHEYLKKNARLTGELMLDRFVGAVHDLVVNVSTPV